MGRGVAPSWINTSTDAGTTWTWQRNVVGIDGDLAILQDPTGTPQIQLTNPHGDVIATVDDTSTATGTNATFENTEYGAPRPQNTTNPTRYEWLGGKQRSDDALGGLTLMGVRLYNPTAGRFLTTDTVPGGNENAYNYPNDPVNGLDLDGNWGFHFHWNYRQTVSQVWHNSTFQASAATFKFTLDVSSFFVGTGIARGAARGGLRYAARREGRHAKWRELLRRAPSM